MMPTDVSASLGRASTYLERHTSGKFGGWEITGLRSTYTPVCGTRCCTANIKNADAAGGPTNDLAGLFQLGKRNQAKSIVVAMALAYLIALQVFMAGHASAVSGKIVHAAIRP
jgi:hypothetical protein